MSDLSGMPLEQLAWGLADALERASHAAYQARRAEEQAAEFRLALQTRLTVGEVVFVDDELQVVCLPPRAGTRSVDREGILRHAESLEPLGLAPREVASLKWPSVADVDRQKDLLHRAGIDPGELLVVPPAGAPRIEVQARKKAVVT